LQLLRCLLGPLAVAHFYEGYDCIGNYTAENRTQEPAYEIALFHGQFSGASVTVKEIGFAVVLIFSLLF
jgi:hypothetical protein